MDVMEFLKSKGLHDEFIRENQIVIVPNKTLIDFFVVESDFSETTRRGYQNDLEYFIKKAKIKNLQDVSTGTVAKFIRILKKNLKFGKARKRRILAAIRSFFKFYRTEEIEEYQFVRFPEFKKIKFKERVAKVRSNKELVLSKEETIVLLQQLKVLNLKHYLIARLMVGSGMRIGDILAIDLNNIDFEKRKVRTMTKTGERTYYFNENTKKELAFYLELRKEVTEVYRETATDEEKQIEHLFLDSKNRAISPRSYPSQFGRILKQIGCCVEDQFGHTASCHTLRRTFATIRSRLGQIKEQISFLLGHTIKNVTDLYIKKSDEEKLAIFDSFDFLASI